MLQRQTHKYSCREFIKALEADIHHANSLVAALPRELAGDSVQMKLSLSPFAPFFLFLIEWMNCSCFDTFLSCLGLLQILVYKVYIDGMPIVTPEERRATLREFYAVIYPMLMQLEGNLMEVMDDNLKKTRCSNLEEKYKRACTDLEREDECGICMEMESNIVLPSCGHSMCIGCFHNWYIQSQSCPFCRGCLKRVTSEDLWILTSNCDVVDAMTLAKENLRHFYLYIEKLPLVMTDHSMLMYNYLMCYDGSKLLIFH